MNNFMPEPMKTALLEARAAMNHNDVPIGAVLVVDGKIICQAHNEKELKKDPTAHAEILLLQKASKIFQSWHLDNATLYVTLEPCLMCAGAIIAARIDKVVFATPDPKGGACGSLYNFCQDIRLNHNLKIELDVSAEKESSLIISEFFRKKRLQN